MPKVHTVKRSRKAQGQCGRCGDALPAGSAYIYWEFRFGGRRVRCTKPGCRPARSELTQSEILSTIWSQVDGFRAEGDSAEDIATSLRDFADNFRSEVVEGLFQEKLDNIESGMGHTDVPVYEELQERMYELEGYCDNMESVADEIAGAEMEEGADVLEWLGDLGNQAEEAVNECPE